MSEIVLFHHVLGLTDGVTAFADRVRAAGHDVRTPDLFEGARFASIEEGFAHVQSIGFEEVLARGVAAFREEPGDVVGGLSLGVMPAQTILQTTPGLRAAFFLHAFIDPAELPGAWPDGVPVHVHGAERDPFFAEEGDLEAARTWQREHENLEIELHPGSGHLFTDSSTGDFDQAATARVLEDLVGLLPR